MKTFFALVLLFLTGCSSLSFDQHLARVEVMRARLPQVYEMKGNSMLLSVSNTRQVVAPFPYDKLRPGMIVTFWPYGRNVPLTHHVERKIGTDCWLTSGENQPDDLKIFGMILTRKNYIGVTL